MWVNEMVFPNLIEILQVLIGHYSRREVELTWSEIDGTVMLSTRSVISSDVWDPDSLYKEESPAPMTRVLVSRSFY